MADISRRHSASGKVLAAVPEVAADSFAGSRLADRVLLRSMVQRGADYLSEYVALSDWSRPQLEGVVEMTLRAALGEFEEPALEGQHASD